MSSITFDFAEFGLEAPSFAQTQPAMPTQKGGSRHIPMESIFEKYSASQAEARPAMIWSSTAAGHDYTAFPEDDGVISVSPHLQNGSPTVGATFGGGSVDIGTVSPQDLMTTCSTNASNSFSDVDYSPLFTDSNDMSAGVIEEAASKSWGSLFSETPSVSPQSLEPVKQEEVQEKFQAIASAPAAAPAFEAVAESPASGSLKRKRSTSPADLPYNVKKDEYGITAYSRKPRSAPLQPITIDEDAEDSVSKRARNTEAARRSRARKMERMVQLEAKLKEMAQLNQELQREVSRLKRICGE